MSILNTSDPYTVRPLTLGSTGITNLEGICCIIYFGWGGGKKV